MNHETPVRLAGPRRVKLGEETCAPAGAITFEIPGALVTLDPARPLRLPHCHVIDADQAAEAVHQLYGAAAVQAIADTATDEQDRSCVVSRTPALEQLARLGQIRWQLLLSPLPLDGDLLRLEERYLLGELADLLEDEPDWVASLSALCEQLVGMQPAETHVEELLTDSLELLTSHAPVTTDAYATAVKLLQQDRAPAAAFEHPSPQWLVDALQPKVALAAQLPEEHGYAGTGTVDWFDVPRGQTSTSEDNAQWRLRSGAAPTIEVTVEGPPPVLRYGAKEAHRPSAVLDQLYFDVSAGAWPLPVISGTLSFAPQPGRWVGQTAGTPDQLDILRKAIDAGELINLRVRARGFSLPEKKPAEAYAHRLACRAVAASRMSQRHDDAWAQAAQASFALAGQAYLQAGWPQQAADCDELAAAKPEPCQLSVAEIWLSKAPHMGRAGGA